MAKREIEVDAHGANWYPYDKGGRTMGMIIAKIVFVILILGLIAELLEPFFSLIPEPKEPTKEEIEKKLEELGDSPEALKMKIENFRELVRNPFDEKWTKKLKESGEYDQAVKEAREYYQKYIDEFEEKLKHGKR